MFPNNGYVLIGIKRFVVVFYKHNRKQVLNFYCKGEMKKISKNLGVVFTNCMYMKFGNF